MSDILETRRPAARFHRLATDAAPTGEGLDLWRSLFVDHAELWTPERADRRGYHGEYLVCAGDDGVHFARITCDATRSRFRRDGCDEVLLAGVVHGTGRFSHGDDERDVVGPETGLYLMDGPRGPASDSTAHRNIYLAIPRAVAVQAMGGDAPLGRKALMKLPDSALGRILWAQMQALAEHGPDLAPHEAATAMQATSLLGQSLLRQLRPDRSADRAWRDEALVLAADRLIHQRGGDLGLTGASVAAALGCSRSRLYQALKAQGVSLHDTLARVRFERARALLRDPMQSVSDVADVLGYADASAFGKAFRRAFGISPGDWRRMEGAAGSPRA